MVKIVKNGDENGENGEIAKRTSIIATPIECFYRAYVVNEVIWSAEHAKNFGCLRDPQVVYHGVCLHSCFCEVR